jgi:hypothetical protein
MIGNWIEGGTFKLLHAMQYAEMQICCLPYHGKPIKRQSRGRCPAVKSTCQLLPDLVACLYGAPSEQPCTDRDC